ncbi:hypothetical protein ABK905_11175 [Acerihabitans sp. KWT182]|uniref:Amidohydrolase-related domain-containing protein n=1 Tax=Acerihabitans sp. KWT182 TaxID=3157919 RepID=A0AAU7QE29_9GAMM
MSKIVDSNMHWLPGDLFSDKDLLNGFLDCVPRQYGVHTRVEQIEGKDLRQLIIEQPKGYQNLNYAEGQYTLESQLADMEKAGVDHVIFRLPVWQEWLDLETCKKVNDRMAEYVKRSDGKMSALAVVPPLGHRRRPAGSGPLPEQAGFSRRPDSRPLRPDLPRRSGLSPLSQLSQFT